MDRLHNGATLGPFRIIHPIGEGGMAKVYKAYQPSMERYVALKVLPAYYAEDPQFFERFAREARVIARLEHQNILPVFDYGEQDGITYLAMRYVEGGTLKELLSRGKLTLRDTLQILTQVCSALDYAHRQGIIHRDVKPSNIILDREGAVYLTDFGIAKVLGAGQDLTGTGAAIGTPAYMAPEQALGEKVDGRTDIYALGIILYEMVVGRVPYQADTPMAILMAHLRDPLPLPRDINKDIPEEIEAVIIKALAKDPADRYQTANEMAQALRQAVYISSPEVMETTLINLIREVQAHKRGIETISEPDLESDPRLLARLEQLYIDGLSAYWIQDWNTARTHFQAVVSLRPDYKDATARLAEIEKQLRLVNLYEQAKVAIQIPDWPKAQSLLKQITSLDSSYKDADQLLRQAEKKIELATLYSQAEELFKAEQWQAVIKILERIHQLEPEYQDPQGLLALARRNLAEQKRLEKVKAIYQQGLQSMDENRWKEAQRCFEKVNSLQPGYAKTSQLLQRAILEQTQMREKSRKTATLKVKAPSPSDAQLEQAQAVPAAPSRKLHWSVLVIALALLVVLLVIGSITLNQNQRLRFSFFQRPTSSPTVTMVPTKKPQDTQPAVRLEPTATEKPAESQPLIFLVNNFNTTSSQENLNLTLQNCDLFIHEGGLIYHNEMHLENERSSKNLICQMLTTTNYHPAPVMWPIQAKLKYAPMPANGSSSLWLSFLSEEYNNKDNIQAVCGLYTSESGILYKKFSVWGKHNGEHVNFFDYEVPARYDKWYLSRLGIHPETLAFNCWIDNQLFGTYRPEDAERLRDVRFTRFIETNRSPSVKAHTVVDDIYTLQYPVDEEVRKPPSDTETLSMRLQLKTTSDWAEIFLLSKGFFVNPRLVSFDGAIVESIKHLKRISIMQDAGRASTGHAVSIQLDVNLADFTGTSELILGINKGCIGEAEANIYNTVDGILKLVEHLQSDSCAHVVPFHVPIELLTSQNPAVVYETIPLPSMPEELDTDASKQLLICEKSSPPQFCVRNVLTGIPVPITHEKEFAFNQIQSFSWSPDGKSIVFSASKDENQPFQVYTINADGTNLQQLTHDAQSFFYPIYTPNGNWIAAIQECRNIWIFRPNNPTERYKIATAEGDFCYHRPAWSPDGGRIALLNDYDNQHQILMVTLENREVRKISEIPPDILKSGYYLKNLAWNPDGKLVGVFYGSDQETWGILIDVNSLLVIPVDWSAPSWWLPTFWPQWGIK